MVGGENRSFLLADRDEVGRPSGARQLLEGAVMRRLRMFLSLVGLGLLWSGCASTTMVFTEPGNAEIVVDGNLIGRSPVLYAGSLGSAIVTARLPEYQESTVDVSRELFFWGWYLPDAVHIRLEPVEDSQFPQNGNR
jgi:hypothetical protein